jgi:hypothetical protein
MVVAMAAVKADAVQKDAVIVRVEEVCQMTMITTIGVAVGDIKDLAEDGHDLSLLPVHPPAAEVDGPPEDVEVVQGDDDLVHIQEVDHVAVGEEVVIMMTAKIVEGQALDLMNEVEVGKGVENAIQMKRKEVPFIMPMLQVIISPKKGSRLKPRLVLVEKVARENLTKAMITTDVDIITIIITTVTVREAVAMIEEVNEKGVTMTASTMTFNLHPVLLLNGAEVAGTRNDVGIQSDEIPHRNHAHLRKMISIMIRMLRIKEERVTVRRRKRKNAETDTATVVVVVRIMAVVPQLILVKYASIKSIRFSPSRRTPYKRHY